jgi:tripartite-type tricarboxylate transporter receptor subunit TctC
MPKGTRGGSILLRRLSVKWVSFKSALTPTIAEAGIAGFDFPIWYGIWVPAGTPAAVVDKLSKDIGRVLSGSDLRDWIQQHGGEPMSMTPPEFARFVQGESESAARLIGSSNP